MITFSGYVEPSLRKYDLAYVDNNRDFVVGSCGHTVVLKTEPHTLTNRENGREDYQLLYISKGKYSFFVDGEEKIVSEGQAVLYCPNEPQHYHSLGNSDVEINWTHFTGKSCKSYLDSLGFTKSGVYDVGNNDKFSMLYKWIIKEIQLRRSGYLDVATDYFKIILQLMSRNISSREDSSEIYYAEKAIIHFYRNFHKEISIDDYAQSLDITPSWFRKCFKKRTGVSPKQFINDIRLAYAREMLINSDLKIAEIAEQAGYENAYYFSRIFAKNTGCSPMQFRKNNTRL